MLLKHLVPASVLCLHDNSLFVLSQCSRLIEPVVSRQLELTI